MITSDPFTYLLDPATPMRPVDMITAPTSLRALQSLQYGSLAMELGLIAACTLFKNSRDAFGYFLYVLLGFAVLFMSLEVTVIRMVAKL